jgi:hypothetical protein
MSIALLITVMFIVPMNAGAGDVEKNNGILPNENAVGAVPPDLPYGTRVQAVVDYPSGSDCIRVGYTGTVYCYDSNDPNLPYLINWDQACGFPQSQVCGREAPNGWWVGFNEISMLCPISQFLTISDSNSKNNLELSRAFRDDILSQSAAGKEFTMLYYSHSYEINQIITENPVLFLKTATLFLKTLPAIERALNNNGKLYVKNNVMAEAHRLLDEYEAIASPELAAAIGQVRAFIKNNSIVRRNRVKIDLIK